MLRHISEILPGAIEQILDMPCYRTIPADRAGMFRAIRHNYSLFEQEVRAGRESWMEHNDVYTLGDWVQVMTPIEAAIWSDIRELGLPLWPQLPVGRVFVDFGNPVKRVAVECDGAQWHDKDRDALRDVYLGNMGWRVYRIPGRLCLTDEGSQIMRQVAGHFA